MTSWECEKEAKKSLRFIEVCDENEERIKVTYEVVRRRLCF